MKHFAWNINGLCKYNEKKTVMVNISANINKTNNYLKPKSKVPIYKPPANSTLTPKT
jgi:hypothetical protein